MKEEEMSKVNESEREESMVLSDCNRAQTHNHLVRKQTLSHLAKLTK